MIQKLPRLSDPLAPHSKLVSKHTGQQP